MLKQQAAKWAIVACATMALGAYAYDAGTAYTVPAGTTVTVTDADIASFNSLASVTFGDAAATLVFDTSTAPTVPISGAGTIRKTSTANWTLDTDQSGFTGTWDFEGGETSLAVRYALGSETSASNIYVRSGATLSLDTDAFIFGAKTLHLAGTGVSNRGALRVTVQSSSDGKMIKRTILDDDADLVFVGKSYLFHRHTSGGDVRLNGHTLTMRVSQANQHIYLMTGEVVGPGRFAVTNDTDGAYFTAGPCLRGVKLLDPSVEFVMYDRTSMVIYNHSPTNFLAKLTVEGADCRMYHHHQSKSTGVCTVGPGHDLWEGAVVLKNPTSCLSMGCLERSDDLVYSRYVTGIIGPVSGPGSLMIATAPTYTEDTRGLIYLSCPSNTYTGTTTFNGAYGAMLYVPYSNSIPVYANFNSNVPLLLKPNGEEHGWSAASIARLAESMTCTASDPITRVLVDASQIPGATVTFDGAEIAGDLTGDILDGISGVDGTTLVFRSPLGRPIQPQAVSNSTVKLTGTETLYVTNLPCVSERSNYTGEILFDGVRDVCITGNFPYVISAGSGARRVVFKDSTLVMEQNPEITDDYSSLTQDAVVIGSRDGTKDWPGDLLIDGNSVITARLQIAASAYARGRVVQKGGEVLILSSPKTDARNRFSIGGTDYASGYYELVDGSLKVLGSTMIGRYGDGVFWQKGGDFQTVRHPRNTESSTTTAWFDIGYGDVKSRGHFIATGGTAYFSGSILFPRGTQASGVFTVAGDAVVTTAVGIAYGYLQDAIGIVNLNGGTYACRGSSCFNSRFKMNDYAAKGWFPEVYLNANGGRIRAAVNTSVFGAAYTDDTTATTQAALTRVSLYEKGLTVDVTEKVAYAYRGMTNATGKGVASIPIPRKLGVIASTWVKIEGDGHGASAVAEVDHETGDVTNILVTSAGFDYTWAKATFVDGALNRTNSLTTVDCVLADNVGGGLKVEGTTGRLELHATNNYAGVTELAGGTLKLMCDCAIPADSTIVLSGGKLDMNGHTLEDGAAMPKNWAVDLDRVRAGGTVTNDWNLAFPSGATFSLLNADELTDADANLRTLLYVNGTVSGAPAIGGVDNPMWKVQWSGNRLAMKKITGAVFSVR